MAAPATERKPENNERDHGRSDGQSYEWILPDERPKGQMERLHFIDPLVAMAKEGAALCLGC